MTVETITRERLAYPDLGATVYPHHVPRGLADELPSLYASIFSTMDWFLTQDRRVPTGALILEEPRHVLLFYREGTTVEILNKVFHIAPADALRACRALFRALPRAQRVHLEVLFPPEQLALPRRVVAWTDHMVVELPATVDEYNASLGKSTRRTIRSNLNKVRKVHPDIATATLPPGERTEELFDRFLEWKVTRFSGKGAETYWETEQGLAARTLDLLRLRGEAHVTTIDGKPAVIVFAFEVCGGFAGYEVAFDPQYESFRLGFLTAYEVVCDAISRGARVFNMLWGTEGYKRHLGAAPVRATQLSVFRSQPSRFLSLDETLRIHYRHRMDYYWRARHAAGTVVRAVLRRPRPIDEGSSRARGGPEG